MRRGERILFTGSTEATIFLTLIYWPPREAVEPPSQETLETLLETYYREPALAEGWAI